MTFDDAVAFVIAHEGGVSDDAADAGGLTKYGISKRSYPDVDVLALTVEEASAIYRRDFWDHCHCGELPNGLDLLVFDAAVNQGPGTAVKLLQQAVKVNADGIIGPVTIRAAQAHPDVVKEYLARRMYQYSVVPQVLRFGLGWFRRLADAAALALQGG